MTLLLNCHQLAKAHGSKQLFKKLSFGVFQGDKIGLIGPNGSGKSTLMKILAGLDNADQGDIALRKSLRVGYVPQTSEYPSLSIEQTVFNAFVATHQTHTQHHEIETKVRILLSKLGFKDISQDASTLSGGWKKRVDLAKALINSPDILLLDEPTNHLDLEGIIWLENYLKDESITFIVTSHDRYFLQNVASRMIELNPHYPEGIFCSEGNYLEFLDKRTEFLDYQQQCERALASKVRSEVEWLRQSPKARTTKSTARVQEAGRLIDALSELRTRNRKSSAKIDFEATNRQTRKLVAIKNISKTLGDRLLLEGLDLNLAPGIRLGIVGPNGCGKTTLLKIIAGEIIPDVGTIKYADDLKIVYFDQHRQKLNPTDTLRQALSPNSDTVIYRGQHIHVNSWAKRFLFSPDRLDLPVKQLSGGERARIGIARLMLQPADLLLLDEPTNDLDIPTLETLEESLGEFPGAVVLITHDRAMLDKLTNCVIGLGIPNDTPLLADYSQWEQHLKQSQASQTSLSSQKKPTTGSSAAPRPQKLSYKEKRELELMETSIQTVEKNIATLESLVHTHTTNGNLKELHLACEKLEGAQKELEQLYHRWQELEEKGK